MRLLRLCITQKVLQQPFPSFSLPFLHGLVQVINVFFFSFCFRHVWPILVLLGWYSVFFQAMTFRDNNGEFKQENVGSCSSTTKFILIPLYRQIKYPAYLFNLIPAWNTHYSLINSENVFCFNTKQLFFFNSLSIEWNILGFSLRWCNTSKSENLSIHTTFF